MNTQYATANESMVRFQCFVTRAQHAFLKSLHHRDGISGGYAVRKGIAMYAKHRGVTLPPGPAPTYPIK